MHGKLSGIIGHYLEIDSSSYFIKSANGRWWSLFVVSRHQSVVPYSVVPVSATYTYETVSGQTFGVYHFNSCSTFYEDTSESCVND